MWILLLIQTVLASPVLIKAPEADTSTYQVFLENSDAVAPSQIEIPCSARNTLEQHYLSANDNYVNGSLEKAKAEFLEMSELKWNCDWKSKERALISESLFRLSQLSNEPQEQIHWIQTAIEFDDKQSPDKKLFPPPLISQFEELLKKQTFTVLSTTKYYDTYTRIYRNGKPFSIDKKTLKFPDGQARFTFMSDSHTPKTLIITAAALVKTTVTSPAYIAGDCKKFHFQKPPQWTNGTRLFFSPECIVEQQSNSLLAEAMVSSPSLASGMTTPMNPIGQQIQNDQAPRKKTWIERNYLWVGAALVGAVLISAEMNNRKDTQTVITPTNSLSTK